MTDFLFKSQQLGIRLLEVTDLNDTIMSWFDDESLMAYYTNSKNKITRERLAQAIEQGKVEGNNFTYGIFDLANKICIGTLRLGPINLHHKTSDLVVLIGNKEYHGKGLAVEAIKLGNLIAFQHHGLRKLFGGMYASNKSSIKAYLRAEWVVEGIRKAQYLNQGRDEDRIEVACFNPSLYGEAFLNSARIYTLDEILALYP